MWRPLERNTYQSWIDSILNEASDELSNWESGFIASIQMRLDHGAILNENQAAKLEQIYTKLTK